MDALSKDVDWVQWREKFDISVDWINNKHKLVMEFLVTEGYEEATEKFRLESGTEPHISTATMTDRAAIKKAILDGNMEDAIRQVEDRYREVVRNPQLHFYLHRQQFIELIRRRKLGDALNLAHVKLAAEAAKDERLLVELERTILLVAYEDATSCPARKLLDMSQRVKTASQVNAAILVTQIDERDPRLPIKLEEQILLRNVGKRSKTPNQVGRANIAANIA